MKSLDPYCHGSVIFKKLFRRVKDERFVVLKGEKRVMLIFFWFLSG